MADSINFIFESTAQGSYVDVLACSAKLEGCISTQNAGSSNAGIYYQVGGGGLNGIFTAALSNAGVLSDVNHELINCYNARYGEGSYDDDKDSASQERLTTLLVGLPRGSGIGSKVIAMSYSVGPKLSAEGITNRDQYAGIYRDAVAQCAGWNKTRDSKIDALRITMLSTGIYARNVDNPTKLMHDSAELIIKGVHDAVMQDLENAPNTILINSRYTHGDKERSAFNSVYKDRQFSIMPHAAGFTVALN